MEPDFSNKNILYQSFFNLADCICVAVGIDGQILEINQKGCEILGFSKEALVGRDWFDFCLPEMRGTLKTEHARIISGKVKHETTIEFAIINKDNNPHSISCRYKPLQFGENISGVMLAGVDVVQRKKTGASLHESEERFRSIIRSIDNMIYTLDYSQKITGIFGGWLLENDFTPDSLLGKTPSEVWGEKAGRLHAKANAKALQGENVEFEWSPKNGSKIYLTSVSPLRDAEGKINGLVGVGRDITEMTNARAALQESEARGRAILETAVDAIITIDEKGIINSFNSAAEKIFGYSAEEAIGQNISILMPADRGHHDGYMQNYYTSGRKKIIGIGREEAGKKKDGTVFPIHLSVSEVMLSNRRLFTSIIRDVTEQENLQQKILQSERLAIIGKMAAKVAHEIRNPLASVSLNAELLGDEIPENGQEARSLLSSMIQEIDRVASLTEEYLQFSRLPASKLIRDELSELVRDSINFFKEELRQRNIEIEFSDTDFPIYLNFDRTQLKRILINIFRNAEEAMAKGGAISVWMEQNESHGIINIRDTGSGIPEDMIENIFTPFFTTKMFGTGLGLAICEQVIQEHGGKISCKSKIDFGTTFRIELPIDK